jgi:hypothetical protein
MPLIAAFPQECAGQHAYVGPAQRPSRAQVTIMPAQMMTGLFGMNFQGSPETRVRSKRGQCHDCAHSSLSEGPRRPRRDPEWPVPWLHTRVTRVLAGGNLTQTK